jgi:hypothetical protein
MRKSAVNGKKNMARSTARIPRQMKTRFIILIIAPPLIAKGIYPDVAVPKLRKKYSMLYFFSIDIQYIRLISCLVTLRDRITPLPKPMQSASLGKCYVEANSVSREKRPARGGVWADCA